MYLFKNVTPTIHVKQTVMMKNCNLRAVCSPGVISHLPNFLYIWIETICLSPAVPQIF